ncbi:MAG: MMPL family transporter [bacterium]|nr:MMPL family transporter [bacterium]
MQALMLWSYKHPKIVVTLLLGITLFFSYFIPAITSTSSTKTLWSKDDPMEALYDDTLETFGSDKMTVIFVKESQLFTPEMLARLSEFQGVLEDLPDVDRVDSLFSSANPKGEEGELMMEAFVEEVPDTLEEAQAIEADALRNPIAVNNLVSRDGSAMTFNLFLDNDLSSAEEMSFSRQLDDIIATLSPHVEEVFQLGTAYTMRILNEGQMHDQRLLIPLAYLLFALLSFVIWRSFSLLGMTTLTSVLSVLWTLGFMGLFRLPLNMLTVIMPALLVAVGSTEDIHLFSEYLTGVRETGARSTAIPYMIRRSSNAILLTSLTTFLGFLAIALNSIVILQQFGIVCAFGLLANPLITFLVTPAYLRYLGPQQVSYATGGSAAKLIDDILSRLARAITHLIRVYRWQTFGVLTGGILLLGLFTFNIKVDNNPLASFKPSAPIRQASQQLHEELAGVQTFLIHISSGTAETFKQPESLAQIAAIQQELRQSDWCDLTTSVVDYLVLMNREMHDGDGTYARVPESSALVAQYMLLLPSYDMDSLMTYDASEVSIVVRHNVSSSHDLKDVVARTSDTIEQHVNPHFDWRITGESILSMMAADTLVAGQVKSLSSVLLVVFLLMSLLFVNVKAGALSLVPNMLPIILLGGFMGVLGFVLEIGTSMVAVIAIGIAVDDTIHFMTRYHAAMRRLQNQDQAIEACIQQEIRPIVATSFGLAVGFGTLMLSDMLPLVHFGFLSAIVMLFALVMDLIITPILLSSTQLLTLWDMFTLNVQQTVIQDSPLFQNLKRWHVKKVVLLGRMQEAKQGDTVIRQGDTGRSMYLLLEGGVQVEVGDEQNGTPPLVVHHIGPGEIFGEIALVNPGPRSADVRAVSNVTYVELDWESIERIRRIYPRIAAHLYRNLAYILGARLRDNTQKMLM